MVQEQFMVLCILVLVFNSNTTGYTKNNKVLYIELHSDSSLMKYDQYLYLKVIADVESPLTLFTGWEGIYDKNFNLTVPGSSITTTYTWQSPNNSVSGLYWDGSPETFSGNLYNSNTIYETEFVETPFILQYGISIYPKVTKSSPAVITLNFPASFSSTNYALTTGIQTDGGATQHLRQYNTTNRTNSSMVVGWYSTLTTKDTGTFFYMLAGF